MHCLICHRPLRPYGVSKTDAPGTLAHAGRGLCWKHYIEVKPAGFAGYPELDRATSTKPTTAPDPEEEIGEPDVATISALNYYIARRRERLARLNHRSAA